MSRIDRLRASLEEPLLVTNGVNVRYLVGFSSSNAALFVEPERVRLFSDFRYAEAARAVEGVEFVETKRSLVGGAGRAARGLGRLRGRRRQLLVVGGPARGRARARPAARPRRGAARGQGRGRAGRDPPRRRDHERGLRALRRGALRRPHRARARVAAGRALPRARRRRAGLRDDRRLRARTPPSRTHGRPTARSRPARRSWSTRARWSTATTPTARAPSPPGRCRTSSRPPTRRRSRASSPASQRRGPGSPAWTPTPRRATRSRRPASARTSATASGTASGSRCTRRRASRASRATRSQAGNVATVEPGVYLEGLGGIRIEDLVVVTDGEPEVLTSLDKDLITVS